jgi:hypothetical protein
VADPTQTKGIIAIVLLGATFLIVGLLIFKKAFKPTPYAWYVHISGPDDITGPYAEIEAHRHANKINKAWLKHAENDRNTPLHVATVILAERRG